MIINNSRRTLVYNKKSLRLLCISSSNSNNDNKSGRASAAVVQSKAKDDSIRKKKMDLNPPKGTRDFYPEDQRIQNWLFDNFKKVAYRYGFEEYDAPVVESEELYIRKAGEEVTQQLYNFEDKGGRRLSLRPEMTPSLARMVLAKGNSLNLPLKWFSIPQCWRYERMTRGRRREHYQWNMDIWGVGGVEAEIELLSAIVSLFKDVGITHTDVGIKINSRKILTELMSKSGIPEEKWAPTCVLIDKLEKVSIDDIQSDLEQLGLDRKIIENLLETLKIKEIDELETKLGTSSPGITDLKKIFSLAQAYGIRDWLVFDATVVRGLAYYTGTVFEGFDRLGELRAICGGGRYDQLLETMGGASMPAVGFGFGDAVIMELLMKKGTIPDFSKGSSEIMIYAMNEELQSKAVEAAAVLRNHGWNVDLVLEIKKSKWVFQKAEKNGAGIFINSFLYIYDINYYYCHFKRNFLDGYS